MALAAIIVAASALAEGSTEYWSDRERRILTALALPENATPPADPSNRVSDDEKAVELGRKLFFDPSLSSNGEISCSSCHQPRLYFTDGQPRSIGVGETLRNAPTVVGAAWNRWFYWDGRRDSLWSQALIPFEAMNEMGSSRVAIVRQILGRPGYRDAYTEIFGPVPEKLLGTTLPENAGPYGSREVRNSWHSLPVDVRRRIDRFFANLGKSIAAYERTLAPPRTRFDRYVDALNSGRQPSADNDLSPDEKSGARLFMDSDRTQCLQCHNGTMLTNGDFHNVGTGNFEGEQLDYGRVFGLRAVLMDEFNCLGPYSDAKPEQCKDLRFLNRDAHVPLEGAFKVPTLRGLRHTAPYFHDGRFGTLSEVLEYYSAPPDPAHAGPHELRPLGLKESELRQLELFLLTLSE